MLVLNADVRRRMLMLTQLAEHIQTINALNVFCKVFLENEHRLSIFFVYQYFNCSIC